MSVEMARGYGPALALRHLLGGAVAPRRAMGEAEQAGIGEAMRLAVFGAAILALATFDPETRSLGRAALENVVDGASRRQGLALLGIGVALVGSALWVGYGVAAAATTLLSGCGWSRAAFARSRSIIALSAWFALLPTLLIKGLALLLLPTRMISADPPSLYTAIEVSTALPYVAACLGATFGLPLSRSILVATLVHGGVYLAVVILYLTVPVE